MRGGIGPDMGLARGGHPAASDPAAEQGAGQSPRAWRLHPGPANRRQSPSIQINTYLSHSRPDPEPDLEFPPVDRQPLLFTILGSGLTVI